MSDVPPAGGNNPDSPEIPPRYVGYARPGSPIAEASQIRAMADAYTAYNWVFLINFLMLFATGFLSAFLFGETFAEASILVFTPYVLTAAVVYLASQKANRLYAIAMKRNPNGAIVTGIVLAMQSWLCCGALGYMILQSRLSAELKKAGVRIAFGGPRKEDVEEVISRLQAGTPAPPPPWGPQVDPPGGS